MATLIISQTLVLNGDKLETVKHLRVNTLVDSKGVAVTKGWRDAKEDLQIKDAVERLEVEGWKSTQDIIRTTILGKGKAHRTRIVRFTKVAQTATEAETSTPEAPKAKKPRKSKKPSKNTEQVSQQLHEEAVAYLEDEGFPPEAIERMMDIIEEPLH